MIPANAERVTHVLLSVQHYRKASVLSASSHLLIKSYIIPWLPCFWLDLQTHVASGEFRSDWSFVELSAGLRSPRSPSPGYYLHNGNNGLAKRTTSDEPSEPKS